jgi:hypothetical protein
MAFVNRDAITATRNKLLRNEEQRFIDEVARCANQLQEQQPGLLRSEALRVAELMVARANATKGE